MRKQIVNHYCDFCGKKIMPLMAIINKKTTDVIPNIVTIRHESTDMAYALDICVDCLNEANNGVPLDTHDAFSEQTEGKSNE